MYVLLKLSMNQCSGADGAAVSRQNASRSPTRLADLQKCANMGQIFNKYVLRDPAGPWKGIHLLFKYALSFRPNEHNSANI